MSRLKNVAQKSLGIFEAGRYAAPSGREVQLRTELALAVAGTRLYTPGQFPLDLASRPPVAAPALEVTGETTGAAARRLAETEGLRVALLNFASAKNPGGGFINGAKAQEEDLARCSGLYPCLRSQPTYYEANRAFDSMLYTDHIIYSPQVPFFRDEHLELLENLFVASVITAPAPNAGEALRVDPGCLAQIEQSLRRRALCLLQVAAHCQERNLVLGAWGCGVFRNMPSQVAEAFQLALAHPSLEGAFERVVFAVYDRSPGEPKLEAFRARFGAIPASR